MRLFDARDQVLSFAGGGCGAKPHLEIAVRANRQCESVRGRNHELSLSAIGCRVQEGSYWTAAVEDRGSARQENTSAYDDRMHQRAASGMENHFGTGTISPIASTVIWSLFGTLRRRPHRGIFHLNIFKKCWPLPLAPQECPLRMDHYRQHLSRKDVLAASVPERTPRTPADVNVKVARSSLLINPLSTGTIRISKLLSVSVASGITRL